MATDLEMRIEPGPDGRDEVVISGEIDLATAERFRDLLRQAAEGRSPLVVNLTEVAYLDSAGVAVLFSEARRVALEIVVGPGCLVAPVIEVARLADVATVRVRSSGDGQTGRGARKSVH